MNKQDFKILIYAEEDGRVAWIGTFRGSHKNFDIDELRIVYPMLKEITDAIGKRLENYYKRTQIGTN